ncbi:hypothetical protein [Streptomyces katsurahamanus]|uniref:Uncharacterized protein n=1 Tax=Streptomyces katsurahamanus TaxID=2577098 RepID=A0ABW9NQ28_9ACTN|nr:hypothetical protein [Streptomyces katsurahamanus]MQS35264.1 hypothetical protein [Streptomyces katsurahamanus]
MGNLGGYQWMTTTAKQVGGPTALLVGVGVLSYLTLRGVEAGTTAAYKKLRSVFENEIETTSDEVFAVTADGDDGNGLTVRAGNAIRVLKDVGEAVLVEVIGDQDNPYMVSPTFLASVCDWKSRQA